MNRVPRSISVGRVVVGGLGVILALGAIAGVGHASSGATPQGPVPPAIAALPVPSGTQFSIEPRGMTLLHGGALRIELAFSKDQGGAKAAAPDGLAVLYFTRRAGLTKATAPQPPAILARWRASIEADADLAKRTHGRGGAQMTMVQDPSGGVAAFTWATTADGHGATATGHLPIFFTGLRTSSPEEFAASEAQKLSSSQPRLYDLQPALLGLVATSGGVPASNFVWAPLAFNLEPESKSRFSLDTVAPYDSPPRRTPAASPAGMPAQLMENGPSPFCKATHAARVKGVTFSPDGKLLVSWSSSTEQPGVKIWDLPAGTLRTAVPDTAVEDAALSADGSLLFTGGYEKAVTVRTMPDGRFKARVMGFANRLALVGVTRLASTETGLLFVGEGQLDGFSIFTLPDLKWQASLSSGGEMVADATISPDGKLIASSWQDETVRLFTVPDGKAVNTFGDKAWPVAFSADATLIAYVANRTLTIRSLPDGQIIAQPRIQESDLYPMGQRVAFSRDAKMLAVANNRGGIEIFAAPAWTSQAMLADDNCKGDVKALAFSPDGRLLASGDSWGLVKLWELGGEKRRWALVDPALVKK